jgi:transposase
MTTRRYALRDDQWERIKELLPGSSEWVGVTAKDNRLFVDGVLYRYRAGIPWRDLPSRFGDFRVVHSRHRRWCETSVWERVFKALAEDADNVTQRLSARTSIVLGQLKKGTSSNWTLQRWTEYQDSYRM